jgi:hypothetical protein
MDKIFSPIKGRVYQIIDLVEDTKEKFFEKTSISPSNFKGKGALSELGGESIAKILTIYPVINAEWLLTGKGEILKNSPTNEEKIRPPEDWKDKYLRLLEKYNDCLEEKARLLKEGSKTNG